MEKTNFIYEANSKANAIKFFPNFFGEDLNVSRECTLEDLKKRYLNYCEEYFTKFNPDDDYNRIMIKRAYDYVQQMIEEQVKFEPNKNITKKLLTSYEELISAISEYQFIPHWKNSYSDTQNSSNQQILFEISLLKPVLTKTLENIDSFLEKVSSPEKIGVFYTELIKKLEDLIKSLDDSRDELVEAEISYHDTWNTTMRPSWYHKSPTSYSELGETKKLWRLKRNEACHTILSFFQEIEKINIAVHYATVAFKSQNSVTTNTTEVSELYHCGVENIRKGPHYYCYLSSDERKNITKQNSLKKVHVKKQ